MSWLNELFSLLGASESVVILIVVGVGCIFATAQFVFYRRWRSAFLSTLGKLENEWRQEQANPVASHRLERFLSDEDSHPWFHFITDAAPLLGVLVTVALLSLVQTSLPALLYSGVAMGAALAIHNIFWVARSNLLLRSKRWIHRDLLGESKSLDAVPVEFSEQLKDMVAAFSLVTQQCLQGGQAIANASSVMNELVAGVDAGSKAMVKSMEASRRSIEQSTEAWRASADSSQSMATEAVNQIREGMEAIVSESRDSITQSQQVADRAVNTFYDTAEKISGVVDEIKAAVARVDTSTARLEEGSKSYSNAAAVVGETANNVRNVLGGIEGNLGQINESLKEHGGDVAQLRKSVQDSLNQTDQGMTSTLRDFRNTTNRYQQAAERVEPVFEHLANGVGRFDEALGKLDHAVVQMPPLAESLQQGISRIDEAVANIGRNLEGFDQHLNQSGTAIVDSSRSVQRASAEMNHLWNGTRATLSGVQDATQGLMEPLENLNQASKDLADVAESLKQGKRRARLGFWGRLWGRSAEG